MNIITIHNGRPSISSNDLADICKQPHRKVVARINKMTESGSIDTSKIGRISYTDSMNRSQSAYLLEEREALIVMPFIGGSNAERGQVILVDAFLLARKELNRLHQLHDDPDWQQARLEGKSARREETDAIKELVDYAFANGSANAKHYYGLVTKAVYKELVIFDAVQKISRDDLSAQQLTALNIAERVIAKAITEAIAFGQHYKTVYHLAVERVRQFADLIGRSVPGVNQTLIAHK